MGIVNKCCTFVKHLITLCCLICNLVNNRIISSQLMMEKALMTSIYPELHFNTTEQWMNDPNGLVKFKDEYHLFYQASPEGTEWRDIGWGHAVSSDLATWTQKPNALDATATTMCFSGSAIVLNDELIGFYTACDYEWHGEEFHVLSQTQRAVKYDQNSGTLLELYKEPILDIGSKEFRDPKVIKMSDELWLMVIARSRDHIIEFYQSSNLKKWDKVGEFDDCKLRTGAWECPDLIKLTVNDQEKWVLLLSVDYGTRSGSSGMIYMIGDLRENCFVKDTVAMAGNDFFWFDYGPDIFAGQGFYTEDNSPPTVMAWLNSWQYAKDFPSYGLPQMQSLPRTLSLVKIDSGLRVAQTIPNSVLARARCYDFSVVEKSELTIPSSSILQVTLSNNTNSDLTFILNENNTITITHDANNKTLLFIRKDTTQRLNGCVTNYLCPLVTNILEVTICFDKASVEFFADGGLASCSFRTSELYSTVLVKRIS